MPWEDIEPLPCDPQSLAGYARQAHRDSQGTCLYCGLGVQRAEEPELRFDVWRQLTVEHVIPQRDGKLTKEIRDALTNRFGFAEGEQLASRIGHMNEVTACHLCNSFASRMGHRIAEQVAQFMAHLQDAPQEELLESLAHDIWEVWKIKRTAVRRKLRYLRGRFRQTIGPDEMDTDLPGIRHGLSPDDLDTGMREILRLPPDAP